MIAYAGGARLNFLLAHDLFRKPVATPKQVRGRLFGIMRRCRSGDDQVHGLRAFALLVRFNIEADALSLVQALESGLFHGGDVDEHIACAIVRLDEAVAALAIEKLHDSSLRHRETPLPALLRRRPHAQRLGRTFTYGKASAANGLSHSAGLRNSGGGTSLPMMELH